MKGKISFILFILFLLCLAFSFPGDSSSKDRFLAEKAAIQPQEQPTKKTQDDYLLKMLGRDTDPLGLKEDQALKKLLKQPSIKWAIRAGKKHILE